MKKNTLLLTALVLTSLVIFGGCQSTHSPDPDKVKQLALNQEKRIGEIESLGGAKISNQATHLLRMNNGTTLFLKSSAVSLADAKYNGKQVEVAGNILRTTDGNEVMEVLNIDLVDRQNAITEETPQWVDYGSENLQVSLKYRDDYKIQEEVDKVTLTKIEKITPGSLDGQSASSTDSISTKKQATITIKVISKDNNYNLLEAMGVASDSTADLLTKGYNKSKITQKALDAYKQASTDGSQISYFIKAGYSYQINFTVGQSDTAVTDQNMFYDILASIDFGNITASTNTVGVSATASSTSSTTALAVTSDAEIEASRGSTEIAPATIAGFQNFTSDAMKFSIQYPKSYYFGSGANGGSVVKSYTFSDKPLEDGNGTKINLEIVKGSIPNAKEMEVGGKKLFVNSNGGISDFYVDWGNGKYFHLNGSDNDKAIMQQMASTLQF